MKIGVRKPSLKKSIKSRTTGKAKRAIKKSTIPRYGQKGIGYINDPKKAVYNKVYNNTTVDSKDLFEVNNNTNISSIGFWGCLGSLIQLIFALGQVIIYGGILLIIIWLIIQIVKL